MAFNSYTFLVFFAIVLTLHYLPFGWRTKKLNLLFASYLFYMAWNPPFVVLLWFSTLTDWFIANRIYRAGGRVRRRFWLLVSLGVNLGMLGFFKYGSFLLVNFTAMLHGIGIEYSPAPLDIVLPVGISFYTFQTLSYTLDVYRGHMPPWKSPLDFALFVTFFPQLVAGPIVRAADFLPQCATPRQATLRQFGWGICLMVLGLFQKIVVADGMMAPVVERVYDNTTGVGFSDAWFATLAFAVQIFCDFAGYSTIAIGAALCLGFELPDNFRFPYAAVGFTDLWRRWHISLSTWLRDYLYISLGGNRKGGWRTHVNLMLTMLLGGLWHGASWNFVVWGALHGGYLMGERLVKRYIPGWRIWSQPPGRFLLGLITFFFVCLAWVFFRAEGIEAATSLLRVMLGFETRPDGYAVYKFERHLVLWTLGALLAAHWLMRGTTLEQVIERRHPVVVTAGLVLMAVAIVMMPGEDRAFIYFQF